MISLTGRTALVTGGAAQHRPARIAETLVQCGAKVLSRISTSPPSEGLPSEIGEARRLCVDVSDSSRGDDAGADGRGLRSARHPGRTTPDISGRLMAA
jgi:NAD(P)-dependent dehydrogenase (short-subunit alcohol dehydrogenase family)